MGPREGVLPGMSPLLSHLPLSGQLSTESALLLFQEMEGPAGASQTKGAEGREGGQLVGLSIRPSLSRSHPTPAPLHFPPSPQGRAPSTPHDLAHPCHLSKLLSSLVPSAPAGYPPCQLCTPAHSRLRGAVLAVPQFGMLFTCLACSMPPSSLCLNVTLLRPPGSTQLQLLLPRCTYGFLTHS